MHTDNFGLWVTHLLNDTWAPTLGDTARKFKDGKWRLNPIHVLLNVVPDATGRVARQTGPHDLVRYYEVEFGRKILINTGSCCYTQQIEQAFNIPEFLLKRSRTLSQVASLPHSVIGADLVYQAISKGYALPEELAERAQEYTASR